MQEVPFHVYLKFPMMEKKLLKLILCAEQNHGLSQIFISVFMHTAWPSLNYSDK